MNRPRNTPVEALVSPEKAALASDEQASERLPKQTQPQDNVVWDPNAPETEEDGIRAEAVRRLKVRRMFSRGDGPPK